MFEVLSGKGKVWSSFISVSAFRPKAKQRPLREVGARAGNPPPALVLSLWVGLERREVSRALARAKAKMAHSVVFWGF